VNNKCEKKKGCKYNNPSCGSGYGCVNNVCVKSTGCAYNNPSCLSDQKCVSNKCVPKLPVNLDVDHPVKLSSKVVNKGGLAVFEFIIRNKGTGVARDVEWVVKDDQNKVLAESGTTPIKELGPNKINIVYPIFFYNCPKYIEFRADPNNKIPETNEIDNKGYFNTQLCTKPTKNPPVNDQIIDSDSERESILTGQVRSDLINIEKENLREVECRDCDRENRERDLEERHVEDEWHEGERREVEERHSKDDFEPEEGWMVYNADGWREEEHRDVDSEERNDFEREEEWRRMEEIEREEREIDFELEEEWSRTEREDWIIHNSDEEEIHDFEPERDWRRSGETERDERWMVYNADEEEWSRHSEDDFEPEEGWVVYNADDEWYDDNDDGFYVIENENR